MDTPPPVKSHYEYTIKHDYAKEKALKENAFSVMKSLHGWCPNDKASVLIDLIFNHRPEVVVEIGIYGGKSLIPMAMALKFVGQGVVYGIDPWKNSDSVVGFMDANYDWWAMVDHEQIMNDYLTKVRALGLQDYVRTIRTTSQNADPIHQIDLLHIDGNHSEDSAFFDVQKWVPLVKQDGFIIFDDVDWTTTERAVQWLDENCKRITTFHGNNVWGIWIKL